MNDMTQVIQPRADELTADDLLSGPRTISITSVHVNAGAERPVRITFEGDNGRPFLPCKTVCRVFVAAWGPDANKYVGRRATLYRDPKVKWGGMEVGGIRVSHLSDLERDMVIALTATKGKKAVTTVKPLVTRPAPNSAPGLDLEKWADDVTEKLPTYATVDAMKLDWDPHKVALKNAFPDKFRALNAAIQKRAAEIMAE